MGILIVCCTLFLAIPLWVIAKEINKFNDKQDEE